MSVDERVTSHLGHVASGYWYHLRTIAVDLGQRYLMHCAQAVTLHPDDQARIAAAPDSIDLGVREHCGILTQALVGGLQNGHPCCRCRLCTLPSPSSADGVQRPAAGHVCSKPLTTTIPSNKQFCTNSSATEIQSKTCDYGQIFVRDRCFGRKWLHIFPKKWNGPGRKEKLPCRRRSASCKRTTSHCRAPSKKPETFRNYRTR